MEYSKSEWDIIFWPKTWHKRLNTMLPTLIPGVFVVGLFDMLVAPKSILIDYLLPGGTGMPLKIILFIIFTIMIGILDVFCFAWPIADFCRYLARRSEKFISPGFNTIFMKSYAYSHIFFLPLILLYNPTGFQVEDMVSGIPFITRIIILILLVMDSTQFFWQIGIMLRTISVKSKLELPGKLLVAVAMFIWSSFIALALIFLTNVGYGVFETIGKAT